MTEAIGMRTTVKNKTFASLLLDGFFHSNQLGTRILLLELSCSVLIRKRAYILWLCVTNRGTGDEPRLRQ